jgi:hypothetical protein
LDNTPFFIGGTWGWSTDLRVEGEAEINLAVIAYCFDNPPAHTSTNDETAFTESNDNGLTFSIPKNISNNSGSSSLPQISSFGNNVYVVWQDTSFDTGGARLDIVFSASNDNGLTFSIPLNLTPTPGVRSENSRLDSINNSVYVVWHDSSTTTPGFIPASFTKSDDNGATFDRSLALINVMNIGSIPKISVS